MATAELTFNVENAAVRYNGTDAEPSYRPSHPHTDCATDAL